jgi:two-component system, NarL family, nitrate/nitrite response regulator NarL
MSIRVLIASHIRLYREGLERVLSESPDITLVGSAGSALDAIQQVQKLSPDVGLIDMALPAALSVVRQVTRIREATKVVVLGMPEDEEEVLSCAQIGIAGYVTRDGSISDVLAAVSAAARGEVHVSPKIAGSLFRHIAALSAERPRTSTGLTAREGQILKLMQTGMSNKMISQALGIELATVKNHVHSILAKLGIRRRAEAISLLYRRDLSAGANDGDQSGSTGT